MRTVIITITIALFFIGCQSIDKAEKPEKFIDKDTMEQILYDVAVMNAARGYNVQMLKKYDISPDTYIFEKYNIDSIQYAQNTAYYSANIDGYKTMYGNVERRLDVLSDSLTIMLEVQTKLEDSLKVIKGNERKKEDSIRRANGDTLFKIKDKLIPSRKFPVIKEVLTDSI